VSDVPPPPEPVNEPGFKAAAIPQTVLVRETAKIKSTPRTPQLTSLLKTGPNDESITNKPATEAALREPYTEEQLRKAWNNYVEQRKKFQAEYQMLSQPYRLEDDVITVELLSPVHETMLNNIKSELTGFLREHLRNNNIQVTGQLRTGEEKKIIYTNREKFDFLVEKNPMLRELKDRLGLDTDF
jgi:hypothetical protein